MKGNVESSNDEGEYGNLIHHLGYRKEDRSCPEGWVMDIYGYCRCLYTQYTNTTVNLYSC